MKKISEKIKLIKIEHYLRILIELFLGVILFKVNSVFAIVFVIVISIETIFASIENTLCIYLFLSFFDEVLICDTINGSISRIVMAIILIKLSIFIIKNKIKPNKYHIGIATFFAISFIIGIITYKTISFEVIIVMVNILTFIMFSMSIKIRDDKEIDSLIKKILLTIVYASLVSILHGIINNNFLIEHEGEKISYRFKGTYEPNFMSMFINLGIVSLMFLKDDIKCKWLVYLSFAIMINAVIATVSITGLVVLLIIVCAYVVMKRRQFLNEMKQWGIVFILIILVFSLIKLIINIDINEIFDNQKIEQNINQKNERIENTNEQEKLKIENSATQKNLKIENEENVKSSNELTRNNVSNNSIINRLSFLKQKLIEGDWDRISSGRIPLIKTFVTESFNRSIVNILFGNDMTVKPLYTKYLGGRECSHCSYIDFLYNFGIIGFCVINGYLFIVTKNNIFIGRNILNSKYKNAILLIRILLLIYAVALSMYTKRMCLIFFLI